MDVLFEHWITILRCTLSFILKLYSKMNAFWRSVSCLVNDSPYGGWYMNHYASCMAVPFWFCNFKWAVVCKVCIMGGGGLGTDFLSVINVHTQYIYIETFFLKYFPNCHQHVSSEIAFLIAVTLYRFFHKHIFYSLRLWHKGWIAIL